jgi:hypothetical protein
MRSTSTMGGGQNAIKSLLHPCMIYALTKCLPACCLRFHQRSHVRGALGYSLNRSVSATTNKCENYPGFYNFNRKLTNIVYGQGWNTSSSCSWSTNASNSLLQPCMIYPLTNCVVISAVVPTPTWLALLTARPLEILRNYSVTTATQHMCRRVPRFAPGFGRVCDAGIDLLNECHWTQV